MADLQLNARGTQFARNQCRAAEFIRAFSEQQGLQLSIQQDNYLAPVFLQSELLQVLCEKLAAAEIGVQTVENFAVFDGKVTQAQIDAFQRYSFMLFNAAAAADSGFTQRPDFADYEGYVMWVVKAFEAVQMIEGVPQVEFNSDRFLLHYEPNLDEIKLAINLFGTDIIKVTDINKYLEKDVGVCSNGLWSVYLVNFIYGFALQVVTQNTMYYAQFIGATASETANLTTFFNLTQLFSSVFWLWLSDIVGRKPIYLLVSAAYALTSGLLLVTTEINGYDRQISYMQGMRALMGVAALIGPLGFVIVADLSPPKNRSLAIVMVNAVGGLGAIFSSLLNIYLGSAKKYNTKNLVIGMDEYNYKNVVSYRDALYWSMAGFLLGFVLILFFLKESQPRLIAAKHLKKMGINAPKTKEINAQPMYKVLIQMVTNPDIVILFFSYWINLIGNTNTRTGAQIFIMKMYAFTDGNQAKSYVNTVQIVSLLVSVLVSTVGSKYFLKYFGEIRLLVFSQILQVTESLVNFSLNMPIPKGFLYLTLTLSAITMLICEAIFLQLVSMYTTPQNRGQVLGIFQIGNSIGRTLSGALTGVMYDYNIRDAQMFNTLFASVCVILLVFVKPPIQRMEMDAEASKIAEQQKRENAV